jgi:hypothetical protein
MKRRALPFLLTRERFEAHVAVRNLIGPTERQEAETRSPETNVKVVRRSSMLRWGGVARIGEAVKLQVSFCDRRSRSASSVSHVSLHPVILCLQLKFVAQPLFSIRWLSQFPFFAHEARSVRRRHAAARRAARACEVWHSLPWMTQLQ